jgi:hypothetical protein
VGFVDKLKFHLGSVGVVLSMLEKWNPRGCKSEKEFENSLYKFLHQEMKDFQITLKYNLDSTSKFQRLLGQIAEYKNWDGPIVILLTGETEPNLKKQLEGYIRKEELTPDDWGKTSVTVYDKTEARKVSRKKDDDW